MSDSIIIPPPSALLGPILEQQQQQQQQPQEQQRPSVPKRPNQKKQADRKLPSSAESTAKQRRGSDSAKPKQTKSRNGCITCKLKRLKCDEKKPGCDQCAKRNVTCGGYKKDFKWRPFEEQSISQVVKQASALGPCTHGLTHGASSSEHANPVAAPSRLHGASDHVGDSSAPPSSPPDLASSPAKNAATSSSATAAVADVKAASNHINDHHTHSYHNPSPKSDLCQNTDTSRVPDHKELSQQATMDEPPLSPMNHTVDSTDDSHVLRVPEIGPSCYEYILNQPQSQSPVMTEPHLVPFDFQQRWDQYLAMILEQKSVRPELSYRNGNTLQRFPSQPLSDGLPDIDSLQQDLDESLDDDIEEIPHLPCYHERNTPLPYNHDFFSIRGWDPGVWNDPLRLMKTEPRFAPSSVEMLVSRFDRRTCGIMSVKDGPLENPWRTLVLPLMHSNLMVHHAVLAMTCLHSCKQEPALLELGQQHFNLAFKQLQSVGRSSIAANLDMALAGMLALAFGESWGLTTSTGIDYIKKSKQLMYGAIQECQRSMRDQQHLDRVMFLCKTWIYIDVIARLTAADDDESCDFEYIANMTAQPCGVGGGGGGEHVDPLMGCASSLFPIIGRVANLVRKVCRGTGDHSEWIPLAMNLKRELEAWQPGYIQEVPEDQTTTIAHGLQTAEAYRWATLLYLHQALPEIPSPSSHDLADRTMTCLATIPLSSRAVIVQIYPLLAAGCEASTATDRQWVEDRWSSMGARMAIGNVDRCAEVVREVWRRRDEFTRNPQSAAAGKPMLSSPMSAFSLDIDNEITGLPTWHDLIGLDEHQTLLNMPERPKLPEDSNFRVLPSDTCPETGQMLYEYTVHGSLHWVGVMKDWNWEVLLG